MSIEAAELANEYFTVTRHGDVAMIVPSPEVEQLPENLISPAAAMVLAPLKIDPPMHLIVDLTNVRYFGSAFITSATSGSSRNSASAEWCETYRIAGPSSFGGRER